MQPPRILGTITMKFLKSYLSVCLILATACGGSDTGSSGDDNPPAPSTDMMSADQDMMSTIADAGMAEADVSPMVDSTVMPCECDGRQVCEDASALSLRCVWDMKIVSVTEFAKTAPASQDAEKMGTAHERLDVTRKADGASKSTHVQSMNTAMRVGYASTTRVRTQKSDDDCPGRQTCDASTGRCMEATGCDTDEDRIVATAVMEAASKGASKRRLPVPNPVSMDNAQSLTSAPMIKTTVPTGSVKALNAKHHARNAVLVQICDTGRCQEATPCQTDDGCLVTADVSIQPVKTLL